MKTAQTVGMERQAYMMREAGARAGRQVRNGRGEVVAAVAIRTYRATFGRMVTIPQD